MHTVPNLSSEQRQQVEVRFRHDSTCQLCQLPNETVRSALLAGNLQLPRQFLKDARLREGSADASTAVSS